MPDSEVYIALGRLTSRVADLEGRVLAKIEQTDKAVARIESMIKAEATIKQLRASGMKLTPVGRDTVKLPDADSLD